MTKPRKKRRTFEVAKAWAWEFEGAAAGHPMVLCRWAEPSLLRGVNSPTENARPVAVYIIRRKDFDTCI